MFRAKQAFKATSSLELRVNDGFKMIKEERG